MKTYPLLAALCVVVMGLCSCNDEEPVDSSGAISVTTAEVTNITDNTAQPGGNVILTGGGAIMAKGVCWGTEPDPVVTGNYTQEKGEAGKGLDDAAQAILSDDSRRQAMSAAMASLGTIDAAEKIYGAVMSLRRRGGK